VGIHWPLCSAVQIITVVSTGEAPLLMSSFISERFVKVDSTLYVICLQGF